jgi:hypothetical protein
MPLDFPNAPNVNDTFTSNSRTWKWNGTTWDLVPIGHTHATADLVDFAIGTPATGQALVYNGTKWANSAAIPQASVTNLPSDLANKMATGYGASINFNSYVTAGCYRFEAGNTNGPGSEFDYGQLLVIRGASDTVAQIAFTYSTAKAKIRTAYGVGGTPVFSAWKNLGSASTYIDVTANYTIAASDAGSFIRSNGGAITITVADVFNDGDRVDILQAGSGQVTFAGSGFTVYSSGGKLKTTGQYSAATIMKAGGAYYLIGDITA